MGSQEPIALALMPELGYIHSFRKIQFCSCFFRCSQMMVAVRSKYQKTQFDRLSMHGRGSYHHVVEYGVGNGAIFFDTHQERQEIYWSDQEYRKIGFTSFDGIFIVSSYQNFLAYSNIIYYRNNESHN